VNAGENPPRIFQGVAGNLCVTGFEDLKEKLGDVEVALAVWPET
jgi:hypothetical protein